MGTMQSRTSSRRPFDRRPAHGNRVVRGTVLLGAFAEDYAIAVWVHVRALVTRNAPDRYRRGDPAKPTVVLVPGVYETWLFMKPVADLLNERGYPVAVVRGLGYNRRPVVDTSTRLARALSRRPAPPAGRLVVAHSKGGLVGKHLMLTAGTRLDVRGMVAVCTPFAGSRLARWLLDPSLRAFLPTDSTIVSLSKHADVNSRIVSIYPPVDQHVPDGSQLAGATNVEIDVPGHFRLLSHPLGLAAILDGVESLIAEVTTGPATRDEATADESVVAPDAAEVELGEEPPAGSAAE